MPRTPTANLDTKTSRKRSFWMTDDLYERVGAYVSRHRNSPEDMTINQFVRDAVIEKLGRAEAAEKGRRA